MARLESGGTPESDNLKYWTDEEHGIPWVAISDMTRSFFVRETARRVTEEGRLSKSLRILPAGTLLYSMYASLGKVALLKTEAVINQAILGIAPRASEALRDYLRWWFEFMQAHVRMLSSSNTQDNLSAVRVRNMPVVLPAFIDEQRDIAAFLDRETAKIDALVAKKERLIELLQEKRTALITRAVTRGLDPNVPMKDSGVEWLGEVPAHWEQARLWRLCSAISGGTPTKDNPVYWNGKIPWVSPKDMKRRLISTSQDLITQRAVEEAAIRLVEPRAVLIVVRGMILAHSFPVAVTTAPVTINQDMKALRLVDGVDTSYFAWTLDGLARGIVATVVEEAAHGTRAIRMDQWRNVVCPVPPYAEQRAIAHFLDRTTARTDVLVAKVRDAIDHLKELRTALISAAVTGKIDVREARPR